MNIKKLIKNPNIQIIGLLTIYFLIIGLWIGIRIYECNNTICGWSMNGGEFHKTSFPILHRLIYVLFNGAG